MNSYWTNWTIEDKQSFAKNGELHKGKWSFYKAPDGKFEAVMHGLYMHAYSSEDNMHHDKDGELFVHVSGCEFKKDKNEIREL